MTPVECRMIARESRILNVPFQERLPSRRTLTSAFPIPKSVRPPTLLLSILDDARIEGSNRKPYVISESRN